MNPSLLKISLHVVCFHPVCFFVFFFFSCCPTYDNSTLLCFGWTFILVLKTTSVQKFQSKTTDRWFDGKSWSLNVDRIPKIAKTLGKKNFKKSENINKRLRQSSRWRQNGCNLSEQIQSLPSEGAHLLSSCRLLTLCFFLSPMAVWSLLLFWRTTHPCPPPKPHPTFDCFNGETPQLF